MERLAISADGPYAASASAREVRVWDLTTRRELATIDRKADVAALAMSPDGKWLGVYGKNGKGEIYESLSGKPAHGRVRANIPSVSGNVTHVLSPSGEFEAFSTQDMSKAGPLRMEVEATVRVVRPRAGDAAMVIKPAMEESQGQEHPLQSAGLLGRVSAISKPAFSADSTLLAAGCSDGTVRVWTSKDGKEIMRLGRHQGMVNAVAFGPNGQRLFSAGEDGTVKVWDAKSGAEILTLRGHDGPVLDIALASDGQRLLTVGKDKVVRLWDGGPAPTSGMTASPH